MAAVAKKSGARPVWSGAISFGLVTIPVKLFVAVREKNIHFRTLHDQDHMPLKQKMVCSADGKEVHREHTVKGYEVEKDSFVIVRQEELEAIAPKASKAIEIQDFVELDEIDPLYFDKSYYVSPTVQGAKPYRLLVEAMNKTKKVGIAKILMHSKEYLAALRPVDDGGNQVLVLETMHFSDEVVDAGSVGELGVKGKVDERELKMALQLVDSLTTPFKPEKYHDEYRERVMELIDQKAEGKEVVVRREPEAKASKSNDLIATLEASLARTRAASAVPARSTRRRRSA